MQPRILHLVFTLLALLSLAHAWTKEDHEIFRLRDEVTSSEGPDITFYDFVGVKPSASVEEINKAFKKKSRSIHPDKARHNFVTSKSIPQSKKPGEKRKKGVHVSKGPSQREIERFVKEATARYQRLGVVANVLKGPQRQRYDHFLRHGFPAWKGTGYYYNRFRPGLGTVLVGLFLVGGGAAHYGALLISYNRQREFMEKYIRSARKQAWGDESGIRGIAGLSSPVAVPEPESEPADPMANLNRRQKREYERQQKKDGKKPSTTSKTPAPGRVLGTGEEVPYGSSTTPLGARKRVIAENGKPLIVDSVGNVFLEEEDEDGNTNEYLLDLDEIVKPTWRDTAVYRVPVWAYRKAFDPFLKSTRPVKDVAVPEDEKMKEPEVAVTSESIHNLTTLPVQQQQSQQQDLSSSQMTLDGFEVVDSTGIENEMREGGASSAKKRGKKGKK